MDKKHRANLFIDPDIWRALRVRALEEGTTATDLLNRLIGEYLERTGRRSTAAPRRPRQKGGQ